MKIAAFVALQRVLGLVVLLPIVGPVGAQTIRYIHTDAQGSVAMVTDQSRGVLERREFEPYGASLTATKDGPSYTGHVLDSETGLVYMQQRYYDPDIGRFLSVDPVTALDKSDGSYNAYWYARNNPYRYIDPDGRDPEGYQFKAPPWLQRLIAGSQSEDAGRDGLRAQMVGSFEYEVDRQVETAPDQAMRAIEVVGTAVAFSPIGEVSLAGLEARAALTAGEQFMAGTTLHPRVLEQLLQRDMHAFPSAVEAFGAREGVVSIVPDSRNVPVAKLDIRGEYRGRQGTFEFIKNKSNQIYHRLFKADKD